MNKAIAIVLLFLFIVVVNVNSIVILGDRFKNADKEFLIQQKTILEVLRHIYQPELLREQYKNDAIAWNIRDNLSFYNDSDKIQDFLYCESKRKYNKGDIFSIMDEEQRRCTIGLFYAFYGAKNWNIFYKTLVWSAYHVNEGMFVYALTVALLHRKDMAGMELPAPYEIFPHYFFNSDVIHKAQLFKTRGFDESTRTDGIYNIIIPTNYTSENILMNLDQRISYFTEDVGINTYYYYFHMDYPFWLGDMHKDFKSNQYVRSSNDVHLTKDRRGELWLFELQQLLARYYLERLSNDLGDIPNLILHDKITTGYFPNLHYPNGFSFPTRENNYRLLQNHNYPWLVKFQNHGEDISPMYGNNIHSPSHTDKLGIILQGNVDNSYPILIKPLEPLLPRIFGGTVEQSSNLNIIPSVLEHYETTLRDPVTYMIFKYVLNYYWRLMDMIPEYTYDELSFPGVKIESVHANNLTTYFDRCDSDITNAVDVEENVQNEREEIRQISKHHGSKFVVKARQWRLNHLPFKFRIYVTSEKDVKGVLRVYLGPKYDSYDKEYQPNDKRAHWTFLDATIVDLKEGKNTFVFDSQNLQRFVRDRTPYHELYKWVMDAYDNRTNFPLDMTEAHCGFPARLMLPKGKASGMSFQFYFIISPYKPPTIEYQQGYDHILNCGVGSGARYVDGLSMGFPFDRKMNVNIWPTPNMFYSDVTIFHKRESEINSP